MKNTFVCAYMLSAYTEPLSLINLVDALDSNEVEFYIHIDKKVDDYSFRKPLSSRKNVYFLSEADRVCVYWGGYSQVEMQYNLISAVLKSGHEYTRIVNLTGTDYPLYSNVEILKRFNDRKKEYITGYKIERSITNSNTKKILYYHHMDGSRVLHYFFEIVKIRRKKKMESFDFDFYFGSEYWALTREVLIDIIHRWEKNIQFQDFLKGVFAPSEMWIHTLFFQSQYKEKGRKYKGEYKGLQELSSLTYFQYKEQIKVLGKDDFDIIMQSKKMFARKIIVGKSDELIELIDEKRHSI